MSDLAGLYLHVVAEIHPFLRGRVMLAAVRSRCSSPQQRFQLLPGDPEVFTGKMGYVVSPAGSGCASMSPTS